MGERKKRPHLKLDHTCHILVYENLFTIHCLVKYFLISDCIEDSFEFLFQFAILLLTSAHQKWPSFVFFERMRGDPDLAASWKAHPLDFIQTNRLNKKAPSGEKKPGTKRGGPGEDGGLYMRRLYKCVDTICQHQLHCPIFHLRKHQNLNYFY